MRFSALVSFPQSDATTKMNLLLFSNVICSSTNVRSFPAIENKSPLKVERNCHLNVPLQPSIRPALHKIAQDVYVFPIPKTTIK
jgi:hypothetical protein